MSVEKKKQTPDKWRKYDDAFKAEALRRAAASRSTQAAAPSRPRRPSCRDSRKQLRPLILLATLNLDKLPQLGWVCNEGTHRGLLRFEAEAGLALAGGTYPVVRDVVYGCRQHKTGISTKAGAHNVY